MKNKHKKEVWEEELESLPAINYNLYFGRAEIVEATPKSLTFDASLGQIKDFIRKQKSLSYSEGFKAGKREAQAECLGCTFGHCDFCEKQLSLSKEEEV